MAEEVKETDSNWFDRNSVHKAFANLFIYYNDHEHYTRTKAENIWFGPARIENTAEGQAILTGHEPIVYNDYEELEKHDLIPLYNQNTLYKDYQDPHGFTSNLSENVIINRLRENGILDHTSVEPIMILNNIDNDKIIKYYNYYSWISGLKMPIDIDKQKYFNNEWEHVLPIFHQMIFAGGLAGYSHWDARDFRLKIGEDFRHLNTMKVDTLASNPLTCSLIYHRIKKILKIEDDKYKEIAINREHLNLLCIAKSEKFLNQCKSDSVFVCLKRSGKKYQYHVDIDRIKDFFDGISLEIVRDPDMNFDDEIWQGGLVPKTTDKDALIRTTGKPSNHSYTYITKNANNNQIALGKCLADDFNNQNISLVSGLIRHNNFGSWKEMAINNVTKILQRIVEELNKNIIERTLFNCIYLLCYSHTRWVSIETETDSQTDSETDLRITKKQFKYYSWDPPPQRKFEWERKDLIAYEKVLGNTSIKPYIDLISEDPIEWGSITSEPGIIHERTLRSRSNCPPATPPRHEQRGQLDPANQGRQTAQEFAEHTDYIAEEAPPPTSHRSDFTELKDKNNKRRCKSIEYFVGTCIREIYNLDNQSDFYMKSVDKDHLKKIIGLEKLSVTDSDVSTDDHKDWQEDVLIEVLMDCIEISCCNEPQNQKPDDITRRRLGGQLGGSSKKVLKTKRGKKKLGYKKRK